VRDKAQGFCQEPIAISLRPQRKLGVGVILRIVFLIEETDLTKRGGGNKGATAMNPIALHLRLAVYLVTTAVVVPDLT
jgi:hypothetical protein